MKKPTISTYLLENGIKGKSGAETGAITNLVLRENGVVKRKGHKNLITIKDKNLAPLRINGIFDYSYKENGQDVVCKIVHAGNKLFKLTSDFKNPEEIKSSFTIKDQKSSGFLANGYLFIIGCGDILLYNGSEIKSAYMHKDTYIPTTRTSITDQAHDAKYTEGESENMLNPRRKNTFIGSTLKRTSNLASMFLLDSAVDLNAETILEVKIRTRTSEEEANETTTDYIGVNQSGEEVSTIITLRYERGALNDRVHYFLNEPPRNELGEEINIKIGDKLYKWEELPFGVNVKHGNELYLGFDVTSPWIGKDNISYEFEAKSNYKEALKSVDIGAITNGYTGGEVMLLTLGGSDIYFTDEKRGFFYLPTKNKISLGGSGEKITSICQLWDSLFGAFKENSFYRVRLIKDENGYEVFSSSDIEGAYSIHSTTKSDTDCLVFGKRGIFGVSDYKSSTNITSALYNRSRDISALLLEYKESERENAHSLFYDGYYYLFIGNDAFCANLSKRVGIGSYYEYKFTKWTGCGARVAYADSDGIYFGTEKGEIRKFFDGYYDLFTSTLSKETITLIVNNEGAHTLLTLDEKELEFYKDTTAPRVRLGQHKRLITSVAKKSNDGIKIEAGYKNAIDLFDDDRVEIYSPLGEKIYEGNILSFDPVSKIAEFSDNITLDDGVNYSVYKLFDSFEYELKEEDGGYCLISTEKKEKVLDINELTLIKRCPILCEYQTEQFSVVAPNERCNITGMILYVSDDTTGKIGVELQTKGALYKKEATTEKPLDFNNFSFDGFSLDYPFERVITLGFFVRNPQKISIKISTETCEQFSMNEISLVRR